MKKISLFLFLAVAIVAGCKKDNDSNNDNNDHGGTSDTTTVNTQDSTFVMKAAMANYAEIQAGQRATTVSTDSSILAFAQMMVTDHTSALNDLHAIADTLNLYAPDSLDSAHVALGAQLDSLTGHQFDSVYIHSQVNDHNTAISLFQTEISSGNNNQI